MKGRYIVQCDKCLKKLHIKVQIAPIPEVKIEKRKYVHIVDQKGTLSL